MKPAMKWFIIGIAAMGTIRFALNLGGVPDDIVKYFSMTAIMLAGSLYFALAIPTHKERLKAAYLLVLPYMLVEALALGYTWVSNRQTIFHSHEYSMGYSIAQHTIGHIVGGVTWEPLFVFVVMEIVWAVHSGGRALFRQRTT